MIDSHRTRDEYPYKDEHPHSSSMNEDIEIEKKSSSVVTTLPTLPHNIECEVRVPRSFKIRKSRYDEANKYRRMTTLTWGDFIEESWRLYMDLNHVNGVLVTVEKPSRRQASLNDTVQEIICIGELQEFIDDVEARTSTTPLHHNYVKRLGKILKRCDSIKTQSERLQATMLRAVGYVA